MIPITAPTGTTTHARYVAAKIANDLKRIQRLVGRGIPTDMEISNYRARGDYPAPRRLFRRN